MSAFERSEKTSLVKRGREKSLSAFGDKEKASRVQE
jgi:hypothetical protein